MDEPLEATGSVGLWIHLGLLTIIAKHTDNIFFPNVRELLKVFRRFAEINLAAILHIIF